MSRRMPSSSLAMFNRVGLWRMPLNISYTYIVVDKIFRRRLFHGGKKLKLSLAHILLLLHVAQVNRWHPHLKTRQTKTGLTSNQKDRPKTKKRLETGQTLAGLTSNWQIGRTDFGQVSDNLKHYKKVLSSLMIFTRPLALEGVESTSWNSVHLFVCPSVITSYSYPFLSDSKLRRVTQPLPRYPMSPIHVSHARPHSPVNWSPLPVN